MSERRFSRTHEWVTVEGSAARVGISEFAQAQLGDVVFLELPKPGETLAPGESFGVIESVKAASDLYSPVAGKVLEVNPELAANPDLVNRDPYGAGWLLSVQLEGDVPPDLLDEDAYRQHVAGGA